MLKSEQVLLMGLTAFAVSLLFGSLNMDFYSDSKFGEGFLPLTASIAIIIVIFIKFYFGCKNIHIEKVKGEIGTQSEISDKKSIIIAMIFLILSPIMIYFIGVLISIFIVSFSLSFFIYKHKIYNSLFSSGMITFFIFLIFYVWLKLPII